MSEHPYRQLPPYCFWRTAIADVPPAQVDPVVSAKFQIDRPDRLVTAGSCFAQYIGRVLHQNGFAYLITETAHPMFPEGVAKDYNYGVFSARYGNIYTARQLVQLIHRAYGGFVPAEDIWIGDEGRYIDPFRPQIQPNGFSSFAEYTADRRSISQRCAVPLKRWTFSSSRWGSRKRGLRAPMGPCFRSVLG
jgi:hypothetical protein